MNPSADIAAPLAAPIAVDETQIAVPSTDAPTKKPRGNFDSFIAKVRDATPAWLVNSGTQISLGFKACADGLSVWSSVRKGSSSPWRLTGSLITLGAEILGTKIPEKKITEEKQQEYTQMSKWQYFVTKTREAFNPKEHIAETSGLALIINGFCVAMSGLKQSSKNKKSWEILQGAMTSVAGIIMNYMPDRERAWQIAHTTFMIRSVPAALQARDAWKFGFPEASPPVAKGDWQQGAKWVLNQIANLFGTFYGGVKKLPDGSIEHIGKKGEDITAPRQSRRMVASKDAPAHHPLPLEQPKTQVGQVDRQEMVVEGLEKAAEVA